MYVKKKAPEITSLVAQNQVREASIPNPCTMTDESKSWRQELGLLGQAV